MIQTIPEVKQPGWMLLRLLLFVVVGNLLALLLFTPVAFAVPGFRDMLFEGAPQSAAFLRTMMCISIPVTFFLPAWYLLHYSGIRQIQLFTGTSISPGAGWIAGAVALIILCQPFLNLAGDWNKHLSLPGFLSSVEEWMRQTEAQAAQISQRVTSTDSIGVLLFNILIIGVMTGFAEEYLFRGVIQNILLSWLRRPHAAIWLTAFLFSFVHFQFYGFLPRLLLGLLLGYLARANGSLWPAVSAHIFNNSAVVLILFLQQNGYIGKVIDSLGTGDTTYVAILSLLFTIALSLLLFRDKKTQ